MRTPPIAGGTATIFIKNEFGSIDNVVVRDNLLSGDPSYTIYVEETPAKPGQITNVLIENNYVERGIYGYYNVANSEPVIRNNVTWQEGVLDPTPYPSRPVDHLPTPYPTGPVDLSPYGPAARAQERAVRDVTPSGISRVFRNTVAVPDPEPPSIPQEARPPRILENIRPQPDGSLRSGALVFHLAGIRSRPRKSFAQQAPGVDGPAGSERM